VGAPVPVSRDHGNDGLGKDDYVGRSLRPPGGPRDRTCCRGSRHTRYRPPAGAPWTDLPYRNLASVWQNYAVAGARRLLIAEAVENVGELDRIRDAVPGAQIIVCRLTASLETMRQRVSLREPGMLREACVARVAELEAVIDVAALGDFSLVPMTTEPSPKPPLRCFHLRNGFRKGWASAAADCLSRQSCVALRDSPRETLANLSITGHLCCLLESASCGNRPVRRASSVTSIKSITCWQLPSSSLCKPCSLSLLRGKGRTGRCLQLARLAGAAPLIDSRA